MSIRSFQAPIRTLLGPGPSDVSPRVLAAMARPTIGHLDPAFVGMMDEVKQLLQYAFQTQNELTFPVSGPGSAGMEACFVNLVEPGDKVVVCRNGVFGGRMKENVARAGGEPILLDAPWGRAIDPKALDETLTANPGTKIVAFVHAETSTGVLSDAKALAEVARRHGCLTIVDTVTSLGGVPVLVDEWGLDAVYAGTQKCLSCTPGLSPLTFSPKALDAVRNRRTPVQSWFMDLSLVLGYWGGGAKRAYHHTAPINALYALHEALLIVKEEGLEHAWARHRRNHEALVAGLAALGLTLLVPEGERTPQLNAVRVPEGVDEAAVRSRLLLEHGIEIGAGLGDLAGKVWRIGIMGHAAHEANVVKCLEALETVLGRKAGAANAARQVYGKQAA